MARRRVAHRRHVRKYAEGELPPERCFYFRGPEAKLNLRAANLARFCELAEGVDDATWAHHLRWGEYSGWVERTIEDPELAREIAELESTPDTPVGTSRSRVLDAIPPPLYRLIPTPTGDRARSAAVQVLHAGARIRLTLPMPSSRGTVLAPVEFGKTTCRTISTDGSPAGEKRAGSCASSGP